MPVYNVELYVEEAIVSILNQSYRNIEFIIIDDCSTDKTWEIVSYYSDIDKRIVSHRFSENRRIADALNFGLQLATGEFIARMDGDDISTVDRIRRLFDYLIENPDISLVGSFMEIINESGQTIGERKLITDYFDLLKIVKFASPVPHIWLCKKSVYDLVGNYRLPGAEDYDFLLRMISKNLMFSNVPDYLYKVRTRDGNTSTSIGYMQFISARLAYKLFLERRMYLQEKTNFKNSDITNTSIARIDVVNKAFHFLRLSLLNIKKRQYIGFFYCLTRSILLSPRIIFYVIYQRISYGFWLSKCINK